MAFEARSTRLSHTTSPLPNGISLGERVRGTEPEDPDLAVHPRDRILLGGRVRAPSGVLGTLPQPSNCACICVKVYESLWAHCMVGGVCAGLCGHV